MIEQEQILNQTPKYSLSKKLNLTDLCLKQICTSQIVSSENNDTVVTPASRLNSKEMVLSIDNIPEQIASNEY